MLDPIKSLVCYLILISFSSLAMGQAENFTIRLSSKGNDIAFDTHYLEVPAGSTVNLRFKNKANPASGILHNIAILKPGTTDEVLSSFEKSEYDLEKIRTHPAVLAISPTLEPSQEAVLKLTKDLLKPGAYPYVCLMPGHADMLGMKGILQVK